MCLDSDLVHQGGNLGQIHRLELFIFSPKSLSLYIHSCPFSCGGTDTVTCTNYQAHTCPMPTIVYNVCVCVCSYASPRALYSFINPSGSQARPQGGACPCRVVSHIPMHTLHTLCMCVYVLHAFPPCIPLCIKFYWRVIVLMFPFVLMYIGGSSCYSLPHTGVV